MAEKNPPLRQALRAGGDGATPWASLPPAWAMVGLPPPRPSTSGAICLMTFPAWKPAEAASSVKGDRSFDEWDSYIEEINKMGDIQAAMDIYNSKISK